ncbi:MAG TPA: amidohydrolase family protein [Anaeromyxobacteraceae bacterium]|nr:amidohydrolase family protein [Anaeromyxobacteraceae bacterium]
MSALVVGPDRHQRTVAIVDGRVASAAPAGARALPCPGGEIAPGAVCAHTHLYSGLARLGLPPPSPPPASFVQILERIWWRLDRALDADLLRASARDHAARALLAGTTALVDHHESPSFIDGSLAVLAAACEELGMRALLCYGATERNFGREEAARGLEECRRLRPTALVRPLVGLHASFTVGDRTVRAAGALARELGTALHVHVAEDRADVEDARARGHAGPLQRLEALGALVPGSVLAHGVHLGRAEVERAGALGCWLVQNPRSNEGNRVGYPASLRHGQRVALGTDGWDADMAVEEEALRRLAAANGDAAPDGRLAAGHALVSERFGAAAEPLAPGALGDLVVREGGRVRHVVVEGRVVVEDGRLTGADAAEIEAASRREVERLRERMARIAAQET